MSLCLRVPDIHLILLAILAGYLCEVRSLKSSRSFFANTGRVILEQSPRPELFIEMHLAHVYGFFCFGVGVKEGKRKLLLALHIHLVPGLEAVLAGHGGHVEGGIHGSFTTSAKTAPRIEALGVSLSGIEHDAGTVSLHLHLCFSLSSVTDSIRV